LKLTIRDAAKVLNVDEDTVYRWVKNGTLPSIRISDQYRLNSTDLLEWATARGHRLAVEELQLSGEDLPDLSQALTAGGLHRYAGPAGREAVLKGIVDALPVDEAERPTIHELVTAREYIGSTGIGEGIAIPHVRTPLIVHGALGSMALWYLPAPVDFLSPDGKPVDTVFFLITSTPRVHLHLLSRLATALHDGAFREALKRRVSLEAVVAEAERVEALVSHP
jgi:PTS system nitrogen regulatory IIA component